MAGEGADNFGMWMTFSGFMAMTDVRLNEWKARGMDTIYFNTGGGTSGLSSVLWGHGGNQRLTGNPATVGAGAEWSAQRQIRDSNIIARCNARGIETYLIIWTANIALPDRMFSAWFDDAAWNGVTLPAIGDGAAMMNLYGGTGIAFDGEHYGGNGSAWTPTGGGSQGQPEATVRAKVRQRGTDIGNRITANKPNCPICFYYWQAPDSWGEEARRLSGTFNFGTGLLIWNLADGLVGSNIASFTGWSDIDMKQPNGPATFHEAYKWDHNRVHAYIARNFVNKAAAATKLHNSHFTWIDSNPGGSAFEQARTQAHVADQLNHVRNWSEGRRFANFCYQDPHIFNYGSPQNYFPAILDASTTKTVDATTPTFASVSTGSSNLTTGPVNVTGQARDDWAIRAIRWTNSANGTSGVASMTWVVESGTYQTTQVWRMDWSITGIAVTAGVLNVITITVEDIHGLTATHTINAGSLTGSQTVAPSAIATAEAVSAPSVAGGGAPSPFSYDEEVLADSPVAYWRLGEATGATTAVDDGGANDGVHTGGVTVGITGLLPNGDTNKAIDLNGTTAYVSVPDAAALDLQAPFTLEAWVNLDTISGGAETPFSKAGAYRLAIGATGLVRFTTLGVLDYDFTTPTLVAGTTYHIVVVFDTAFDAHLYVNGTFRQTQLGTANALTSASNLTLGTNSVDFLDGKLDELALYNTALSAGRIGAHYTAATTTAADLIAPAGIASGEAVGTPVLVPHRVFPPSVDSAETFGTAQVIVGVLSPYKTVVLGDDPVSFWRLSELSGDTATDELGVNDATYANVELGQPGPLTGDPNASIAISGLGSASVVTRAAPATLSGTWSFEAWTWVGDLAARRTFFGSRYPNDFGCQFSWGTSGGIELVVGTGTEVFSTAFLPPEESPLGRWVHVVITRGSGVVTVYLDGPQFATWTPATASPLVLFDPTHDIAIGARGAAGGENFFGFMDEVAVYDTALTPAQVIEHRNAALADQLVLNAGAIASAEMFGSATVEGGVAAGLIGDLTLVINDVSHGLTVNNVDHSLIVDEKQRGLLIDRNT